MREVSFKFKQFSITDNRCGMKIGTDGVLLGAWLNCDGINSGIDIGCGSGLIAMMVTQRCGASMTAIEVDSGAYLDAVENVNSSPWRDKIEIIQNDFRSYHPKKSVDLIVSNPPFFANGEKSPTAIRAAARHEGTLNYSTLIDYAAIHLNKTGRLAFIYETGREDEIIYQAEISHLKLRRICHVRQRSDKPIIRTLYEFSPTDGPIETQSLTLCERDGIYTPAFKILTKDFYL